MNEENLSEIEIIKQLQEENEQLREENDSLWFLLDEIKKADIKNWTHLLSQLKSTIASRALMATTLKADC